MTPTITARLTLADAAQDVVDSALYSNECYVTVNRVDGLEACIPEQRAIEAATTALLAAVKAVECDLATPSFSRGNRPFEGQWKGVVAAAETLDKLIGGEA
jgi:hypothetical protein